MQFFVIVVNPYGVPGKLIGTSGWEDAVAKVKALVAAEQGEGADALKPAEVSAEIAEAIETDGHYEYENGGGIYIVCPDEE